MSQIRHFGYKNRILKETDLERLKRYLSFCKIFMHWWYSMLLFQQSSWKSYTVLRLCSDCYASAGIVMPLRGLYAFAAISFSMSRCKQYVQFDKSIHTSVMPLRRESWYHHNLFYPFHTGSFYYEANWERIWRCAVASNLDMYNRNTKMVLSFTVMARIKQEHEVLFESGFCYHSISSRYVIYSIFNIFHFLSDIFCSSFWVGIENVSDENLRDSLPELKALIIGWKRTIPWKVLWRMEKIEKLGIIQSRS